MSETREPKFMIKHDNGTYYRFMTAIGPCFGGTEENAAKFESRQEIADLMMRSNLGFACVDIVELS